MAVIVFAPGASATDLEKALPANSTGNPCTLNDTSVPSATVPVTVVEAAASCALSRGEATIRTGGVRSRVK